jgi:enoyl-CoA hydratase/carnithine racemase
VQVRTTLEAMVGIVELDSPPDNYIDLGGMNALIHSLKAFDADAACRAILICSNGRNFCAGANLSANIGMVSNAFYESAVQIFNIGKPIIAAIQGAAVGAGLGLAVAADFRVASPDAKFVANFVKLGFHPGFALTHTLPRLIGAQKAHLILLGGERIAAQQAFDWGLVDKIVHAGEHRAAAIGMAAEFAANAPLAVQATKETLRTGLFDAAQTAVELEFKKQVELMKTEDFKEGVAAYRERRPAVFKAR